jgi:hypothetical protein
VLRQAHAAIREHDPKIARSARNKQTSWQIVSPHVWANGGQAQIHLIRKNMDMSFHIFVKPASMES